ncbi:MAG: helix-turn-helix domain-containing protein [Actinomycetes bacterium]
MGSEASGARSSSATKRLTGEERRERLLDVAATLFADRGYRSTTMDDVAEAAGVTKPVVYQHFESKRALYLELVDALAYELLTAFADVTASAQGPRDLVERSLQAYFRLMVEDQAAFRLLTDRDHGDDEDLGRAVRRVEQALVVAIDPLIDAGLDAEHRIVLAGGMLGMAEGASIAWMTRRSSTKASLTATQLQDEADLMARRVAELMWAGLRSVHSD